MFVRVAINIPSEKTFFYSVPEVLEKDIAIGKRVLIPLGKRRLTGYILELTSSTDYENIKDIIDVLDPEPLFTDDDLRFYQWVSRYYIYPLGKTLTDILPSGIDQKSAKWIYHVGKETGKYQLAVSQQNIMDILRDSPGGIPVQRLKKILGKRDILGDINTLQGVGLITTEERFTKPEVAPKKERIITLNLESPRGKDNFPSSAEYRKPTSLRPTGGKLTEKEERIINFLKQRGSTSIKSLNESFTNIYPTIKNLMKKERILVTEKEIYRHPGKSPEIGDSSQKVILNEFQESAFREILVSLSCGKFSPILLHGVTGSGKTEVYLNAIQEVLKKKGSVIYLVPEIALTPQLLSRLHGKFGDLDIAVIHSGISSSSRYDQWRQIQRGNIKVIVGARSALFAPARNLKLIIVDEEHDNSYKQEERMRYNARDLAVVKAQQSSATIVLGSATPGIQTFYNCKEGKYCYLTLPKRVEDRPMPEVELIDMRGEKEGRGKDSLPILSSTLKAAIHDTLQKGKQGLLFLNRRGYNTYLFCPDCGYVFKCRNCAVTLTHHASENILKCHYCDYSLKTSFICPVCRGNHVLSYGTGTERLEDEVKKSFPFARVARMDSDTTSRKDASGRILQNLERGEIDILVGTQMITKGHDFPNITLVGVISADSILNMPDFRAAERTFQMLTQVSGRGGRSDFPGKVIVQTFNPGHYAIVHAKQHDYEGFYREEMSIRRDLSYPPYSRFVNLQISSLNREDGMKYVEIIGKFARDLLIADKPKGKIELLGPAEAPIAKMKGKYRWQLLLKGRNSGLLNSLTRNILKESRKNRLDIKVDVDPVNFM